MFTLPNRLFLKCYCTLLSRILRRRAAADATMFLPDVTVVLEELMQLTLTVAALKYIAGVLTNEVNAMLPSGRGNTTF